jgi:hypothetical protein
MKSNSSQLTNSHQVYNYFHERSQNQPHPTLPWSSNQNPLPIRQSWQRNAKLPGLRRLPCLPFQERPGCRRAHRPPLSVQQKVELALELERLFNVPRFDLVLLSEAGTFLAANIIRGERVYAENEVEADEYDLYVLRRAGDLADLERWHMKMILEGE